LPVHLSPEQLQRDLTVRDLTEPSQGPHAIQLLVHAAAESLATAWRLPVRWCRGPRVVPIDDNYDNLLIGPDAVSRDARYTRYLDDRRMLRSHSSSMVPPALRALAADPVDDVLLVCPGVVYRRDAIDWQHSGTPHQLDLWRITRTGPMTVADLEEMTVRLVEALTPGLAYRAEPRVHRQARAPRNRRRRPRRRRGLLAGAAAAPGFSSCRRAGRGRAGLQLPLVPCRRDPGPHPLRRPARHADADGPLRLPWAEPADGHVRRRRAA
jgi:hypothetical protein